MIKSRYTEAFKEQAIEKVAQRGHKTIQTRAEDINVNHYPLKNWLKAYTRGAMSKEITGQRPNDSRPEERFQLFMASTALEAEALSACCRQKGLFTHPLEAWEKALLGAPQTVTKTAADKVLRDAVNRGEKRT